MTIFNAAARQDLNEAYHDDRCTSIDILIECITVVRLQAKIEMIRAMHITFVSNVNVAHNKI